MKLQTAHSGHVQLIQHRKKLPPPPDERVLHRVFDRQELNMLIGYARVSTEDQPPLPQSEALQSAGCEEIFEEHASGGYRARPVLARLLEGVQSGDTLVVVRIDRLAVKRHAKLTAIEG